jgi:hypothetical protein
MGPINQLPKYYAVLHASFNLRKLYGHDDTRQVKHMIIKSRNLTSIADFTIIEIEGGNLKMSRKSRLFVYQTNLPKKIMHCKYRMNFSCLRLHLAQTTIRMYFLG